jgi:hypothetical protein
MHRREQFDAAIIVVFVARGSEHTASEAERREPPGYYKAIRQRDGGREYKKHFAVVNLCSE